MGRTLLFAALDGAGAEEIVSVLDTNCRQRLVYGADANDLWCRRRACTVQPKRPHQNWESMARCKKTLLH